MRIFYGLFQRIIPNVLLPLLVSTLILMIPGPARAGGLVVFSAQGIALKPGDMIDDGKPFILKMGQSVTLIAANGRIFRLKGPHQGVPDPKGSGNQPGMTEALKSLLVSENAQESALGVTRSNSGVFNDSVQNGWVPEPWLVDVTRSGNHCVREGGPVIFWRPDNGRTVPVNVRIGNTVWAANTYWPAGTNRLAPPKEMPVLDGEVYRIRAGSEKSLSHFHLIPATVTSTMAQAAWMKEKGCDAQTTALLITLK